MAQSPQRDGILEKLRVRLLRLASSRSVRPELAEDMVQQVFVVLQQPRYRDLDSEGDLVPLACQTYYFVEKELRRKAQREPQLPEEYDAPGASEDHVRKDLQRRMRDQIEQMGAQCRDLFLLQLDGYSYDEIGEKLGIGKANAYVKVHRCIEKLREKMGVTRAGK